MSNNIIRAGRRKEANKYEACSVLTQTQLSAEQIVHRKQWKVTYSYDTNLQYKCHSTVKYDTSLSGAWKQTFRVPENAELTMKQGIKSCIFV